MKKKYLIILFLALFTFSAYAQDDHFVGEIRLFPYNRIPRDWVKCEGQLLSIQPYQALFSLISINYGGDGVRNFAVPDLRDRMPVGYNQTSSNGSGLSPVNTAQVNAGNNTLNQSNLPPHVHIVTVTASSSAGTSKTPSSAVSIAAPVQEFNNTTRAISYFNTSAADLALPASSLSIAPAGAGNPIAQQPILSTIYCIAVNGIYPSRN